MADTLRRTTFGETDLNDVFFDSLKEQYKEFPDWFARKAAEPVYVIDSDEGSLRGFIYLKEENEAITDITPNLEPARRIKVGTLKIDAHGTKLGERVIKKIFDHALEKDAEQIYVTVFEEHESLIILFKRYGFNKHGIKETQNGNEIVLIKDFNNIENDMILDYPMVHTEERNFFLLAIYPDYHTNLFPDSILVNERHLIIEDVSHTNTIHKVYVAELALTRLQRNDVIVIYRTTDIAGRARFRSVVTSICVVEDVKSRRDFENCDAFLRYALPHSVFTEDELIKWYNDSTRRLFALRMTYNIAFPRRPIRDTLLEDVGITEQPRWDLRRIDRTQFDRIAELSEINERLIID
jgi:L-amino acid N-acyltransferase YncA